MTSLNFPYYYVWKINLKRLFLYKMNCRVLKRLKLNSAIVEFELGHREIISRNALRKRKDINHE